MRAHVIDLPQCDDDCDSSSVVRYSGDYLLFRVCVFFLLWFNCQRIFTSRLRKAHSQTPTGVVMCAKRCARYLRNDRSTIRDRNGRRFLRTFRTAHATIDFGLGLFQHFQALAMMNNDRSESLLVSRKSPANIKNECCSDAFMGFFAARCFRLPREKNGRTNVVQCCGLQVHQTTWWDESDGSV